ncbi:hypothetical protein PGT21_016036 [Puccinia graminis f. sp. tritici]|uniref:Uncharacterized protein n=1 Tax=Puccinia graminis f. sp. tritici TaxID=56615 RepID=A0A5B0S4J9_PUCGR|nr:hypothetical protein PGT21_016036 [Puccinia graminis f. sp. tritici]KAA1131614.1 hypothetical protein PGTUg99_033415 [Puccinia graminis f. sp. tritici]
MNDALGSGKACSVGLSAQPVITNSGLLCISRMSQADDVLQSNDYGEPGFSTLCKVILVEAREKQLCKLSIKSASNQHISTSVTTTTTTSLYKKKVGFIISRASSAERFLKRIT